MAVAGWENADSIIPCAIMCAVLALMSTSVLWVAERRDAKGALRY